MIAFIDQPDCYRTLLEDFQKQNKRPTVAETVDFITGASAAPVLDSEKIIQIQIIIHSLLQNNQVSRPPGWRQTRQL